MKILAVDTATTSCGLALLDDGLLVAETTIVSGETHSKHLLVQIHGLLEMASMTLADLDGFAVSSGPGSFTGVRIGISTVKGLSLACGKPAVGVSTLDSLAAGVPCSDGMVYSMLDARRREIYCAGYLYESGIMKKVSEGRVVSPEVVAEEIEDSAILVGSGALAYRDLFVSACGDRVSFVPDCINTVRASLVGHLGTVMLEKMDEGAGDNIQPVYIRKSDAEMTFKG